ncbi:HAD-like domain-containing protein [Crepidotus variabilis]|uniref:HAD-like domain-containing protein n=1 Tax=Crepidotus variabilis TaxID=179855 RepID=A0A9P6EID6_9AGAR|nr:HAD-like domain-containing protein [Crepidotus variabilis]
MPLRPIRLVTFDALHTIITPRLPIYVQYSQVFEPYVGVLPPEKIKHSFKAALKAAQKHNPSYPKGADIWWQDVIRQTALSSGADPQALDENLSIMVKKLLKRFSSRVGYSAFADAIPTMQQLHDQYGVRSAIISNGDSRLRLVLQDLGFPPFVGPLVLSEEEGTEKPSIQLFAKALELCNEKFLSTEPQVQPFECLHVGDELRCDYEGAVEAGMNALLLRRTGPAGEQAHKEVDEDLQGVEVVENLNKVLDYVKERI